MIKTLLIITASMICFGAKSQSANQKLISAAQKTTISNDFSYSWSLGETIINSNDLTISTGYHSDVSIIIEPVTSNKDENELPIVNFYPNPTNRFLNIDMNRISKKDVIIKIYDLKGSLLTPNIKNSGNINTIDFYEVKTGMYYLQIIDKSTNKITKQFKVIKK